MKTTKKKAKIVGRENYINQTTGEILEMFVTEAEERDYNFYKVWLGHIATTIKAIGNKKMAILEYIWKNTNNQNLLICTQRELVNDLKISLPVITATFNALQESDFMIKVKNGVYRVNPDVIFRGAYGSRMNILIKYKDEKAKSNQEEEDQEQRIQREEERLRNELLEAEKKKLEIEKRLKEIEKSKINN